MQRKSIICLVLAAITLLAHIEVFHCEFLDFDDRTYVTANASVLSGLSLKGLWWALTSYHATNWHPLTWLSHMLDIEIFGLNPAGHHAVNLLLHIANAILLFLLLDKMTGAVWKSACVAALFAIHPLHVESVAWVAERKDLLSAFFGFLTMLAYVRYVKDPGILKYVPVAVLFGLGLMAKPMLVTLPFVLLLLDYWPLGRFEKGPVCAGGVLGHARFAPARLMIEKIPLLALTIASCAVTIQAQKPAMASIVAMPFAARACNAVISYAGYILNALWPVDLASFYPSTPYCHLPRLVVSSVFLAATTALALWLRRSRPHLAVGWFWYLGMLVPVIGIVQVGGQAMADRYTYLPLIGFFIVVVWSLGEIRVQSKTARYACVSALVVFILIPAMVLTSRQTQYWKNDLVLSTHALEVYESAHAGEKDPAAAILYYNVGADLIPQKRLRESESFLSTAVALNPDLAEARYNLGFVLAEQGRFGEAIPNYLRAVKLLPDKPDYHFSLGIALLNTERLDEAISHFTTALRLWPRYPEAHNNLGIALARQGKLSEAAAHFRKAVELNPRLDDARRNMETALRMLDQRETGLGKRP
ncbi:MAG: tetratricopeptide repeat protein [Syntrophobacteraceae bacterium]